VFITAVPITKLFARGGGETMEDMCYEGLRAEASVICFALLVHKMHHPHSHVINICLCEGEGVLYGNVSSV
jgi:hypothetical protein